MDKIVHKEEILWKGIKHELELHDADIVGNIAPITQVQAIPFIDPDHVVIYKHIDGYYGLPGGTVENGENFEESLRREVMEEAAAKILKFGFIGYVKDTEVPTNVIKYQLRYWAHVELLPGPVNDPCGKALEREVVERKYANDKLRWGDRGRILLDLASAKYLAGTR